MKVVSIIQAESYAQLEKLINEEIEFKNQDHQKLYDVELLSSGQNVTVMLIFQSVPQFDFGKGEQDE